MAFEQVGNAKDGGKGDGPKLAPLGKAPSAVAPPGLVSILIPCVGMLEYTKLLVPSLLQHTRPPFELIFLDIGSLDGTAEYLAGLQAAAPCVLKCAGRRRTWESPRCARKLSSRLWASTLSF